MSLDQQVVENGEGNWEMAFLYIVEPNTALHVDELNQARITDSSLRLLRFHTPDGKVYSVDDGIPTLRITRAPANPLLRHINDACYQLLRIGNYLINETDFAAARDASDTVAVNIKQLRLQVTDEGWGCVEIRTSDGYVYDAESKMFVPANEEQSKLINRCGYTDEYLCLLTDRRRNGLKDIPETKIYVWEPSYVEKHAKRGALGEASWLGNFNDNSNFDMHGRRYGRGIYSNYYVRGARRVSGANRVAPQAQDAKKW